MITFKKQCSSDTCIWDLFKDCCLFGKISSYGGGWFIDVPMTVWILESSSIPRGSSFFGIELLTKLYRDSSLKGSVLLRNKFTFGFGNWVTCFVKIFFLVSMNEGFLSFHQIALLLALICTFCSIMAYVWEDDTGRVSTCCILQFEMLVLTNVSTYFTSAFPIASIFSSNCVDYGKTSK